MLVYILVLPLLQKFSVQEEVSNINNNIISKSRKRVETSYYIIKALIYFIHFFYKPETTETTIANFIGSGLLPEPYNLGKAGNS